MKLGVNIDHVATVRQARRGQEPSILSAASLCLKNGADSIVVHLREDRRHIQDADVYALRKSLRGFLNLEMSISPSVVAVAMDVVPDQVTLVPERRQELTTEGGLDVVRQFSKLRPLIRSFQSKEIVVSLFVDPETKHIESSRELNVQAIEIHTGTYALAQSRQARAVELKKIKAAVRLAYRNGLIVNAGHGLDYINTPAIARISEIQELNIGFSIVAHAVEVGLPKAVKRMAQLIRHTSRRQ